MWFKRLSIVKFKKMFSKSESEILGNLTYYVLKFWGIKVFFSAIQKYVILMQFLKTEM